MDSRFQDAIEAASADCAGGGSLRIPSGAGHDAQFLATIMATGTLFVPSVGASAITGARTPLMPPSSQRRRFSWRLCRRLLAD
jgi:beta-ureidopropionase / N-carbamoyl-L-amino-acid hydrolase